MSLALRFISWGVVRPGSQPHTNIRSSLARSIGVLFYAVLVVSKITDLAIDRFREELPRGERMVKYFTECDAELYSKPTRPDGCQIDTFASKFSFELYTLRVLFNEEFAFPIETCDTYLNLRDEFNGLAATCDAGTTTVMDYWPLNCLMLQEEIRLVYVNRTWETNINCNLLTKARADALSPPEEDPLGDDDFVNCNELVDVMLTKFQPFRYTEENQTDLHYKHSCRKNLCTFYRFFFEKIRPRKMQVWNNMTTIDSGQSGAGDCPTNGSNATNGSKASNDTACADAAADAANTGRLLAADPLGSTKIYTDPIFPSASSLDRLDKEVSTVSYAELNRVLAGRDVAPSPDEKRNGECPSTRDLETFPQMETYQVGRDGRARFGNECRSSRKKNIRKKDASRADDRYKDRLRKKRRLARRKGVLNLFNPHNFAHQVRLQRILRELEEEHDAKGVAKTQKKRSDNSRTPRRTGSLHGKRPIPGKDAFKEKTEEDAGKAAQFIERRNQLRHQKENQRVFESKERARRLKLYSEIMVIDDSDWSESELAKRFLAENHRSRNLRGAASRAERTVLNKGQKTKLSTWLERNSYANPLTVFLRHRLKSKALEGLNEVLSFGDGGEGSSKATSAEVEASGQSNFRSGSDYERSLQGTFAESPYTLWPPNFYLEGCNAISYFPFDHYQCEKYQEGQAFCECIIPQLYNGINQVDTTCIPQYEKWFMFGRRGLVQGQMEETCAEGLKEFFWKVRQRPACRVADLPNIEETRYLEFPAEMMATKGLTETEIIGNTAYDTALNLAKQLADTYPSCPWMSHSGEEHIMECMDRFRCNVQWDGWDCCSKSYHNRTSCHFLLSITSDAFLVILDVTGIGYLHP